MRFTKSIAKPLAALVTVGAVVAVTATLASSVAAQPLDRQASGMTQKDVREAPDGKYIVGLNAEPIALYRGGVDGMPATASTDGLGLDRTGSAVDEYRAYLDDERASVLAAVPGVQPYYEYDWAYAGFAAEMTYEQAKVVASTRGVAGVFPNEMYALDTTHTPAFLGLTAPGGLWEQAGGPELAGEGLVLGIVDGGFTPESGSFAPLAEPAPVPVGFTGTCDPGDPDDLGGGAIGDGETQGTQEAAITCDGSVFNNKVIAARYYVEGFGSPDPDDFLSPRDVGGHGSHTGSTSGGNYGVPIEVAGAELGSITGMAPRARIAAYKACWQTPAGGSCASTDTTMAIDQAVADGVDAINYSIGGSRDSANSPDATAFRAAAAAGIFVAVSAGNDGAGGLSTVAHNYPWVTTVAASTQDRVFQADAILRDGTSYTGTSISTGVGPAPAVFAKNAGIAGADPEEAQRCFPGTLDPAVVEGKIVVCIRGTIARTQKSQVVADAGGIGMVLANDGLSMNSTNTERHAVPTVHLGWSDGVAVIDAVGRDAIDPDATLELTTFTERSGDEVEAPNIAAFSSRGPAQMAYGDILKPDVTAPGVDILASLAPYAPQADEMYGFLSGTSMASPHVAGLGILIKYLHPDWSPMAIKSAIITGAYQENNQGDPIKRGDVAATPFEYGAGHVEPQAASAMPLVYESTDVEWVQWMCGTHQIPAADPQCTVGGTIDPSQLNSASIAINDVAGFSEVTRTLTNVTDAEVSAVVAYDVPEGFTFTVDPSELTIPAGGTASYTLRIDYSDGPLDTWRFGSLTWDTGDAEVRSPVVVKAATFAATPELVASESTGTLTDPVVAGVETTINVTSSGLDGAQVDTEVLREPTGLSFPDPPPAELPPHVMKADVEVAEGTDVARFELFADDYVPSTDLDMYVYLDGDQVASSATGAVNEKVTLPDPVPGTYEVYIDLWALADASQTECEVFLHSWVVGGEGVGDFNVTPESFETQIGVRQDMVFSWSGLEGPPPAQLDAPSPDVRRYLGQAVYHEGDTVVASSLLRVDVGRGGDPTTSPPTTGPPTTPPTTPPTDPTTPVPTTTLPGTGGGDAGLYAGLGLGALVVGGFLIAMAARRLRSID